MKELVEPPSKKKKHALCITDNAVDGSVDGSASTASGDLSLTLSVRSQLNVKETMSSQSIDFILARLRAAEPVLCAPAALRAMIPSGKRQFLKTDLLKFCEFVTGWNPDDELNEELDDVEEFDAQLNEDAARRGHRCQMMTLPPDYDRDGLYSFNAADKSLKHRFTNEEIELDDATLSTMRNPGKAVLYSNWSESQAVLKVPGTTFKIILSTLFKTQYVPPVTASPSKGRAPAVAQSTPSDQKPSAIDAAAVVSERGIVPPPPPD